LYEHSNQTRSNFYGTQHDSTVTPIFNDAPTSIKNFKTLSYEGTEGWTADVTTNLQEGEVTDWKKRESLFFNFIKGKATTLANIDTEEFAVQGLGNAGTITRNSNVLTIAIAGGINSSLQVNTQNPPSNPPNQVAAPDIIYYEGSGNIIELGACIEITATTIKVEVDGVIGIGNGDFVFFGKDTKVNTSGIIGYYAETKMITTDSTKEELFSISSEVFTSSE